MFLDVPKEVWTEILKRMRSVGDWGRLQQVSRGFNAILSANCWAQAKKVELKIDDDGGSFGVEVDGRGWLPLSDQKLLLFVKELAEKAVKIEAVSLKVFEETNLPVGARSRVLQHLASASLQVKQLDLHLHLQCIFDSNSAAVPMAAFLTSISGTLETLQMVVSGSVIMVTSLELQQAFQSCRALQTINMEDTRDWKTQPVPTPVPVHLMAVGGFWCEDTMRSIIFGKAQLKSLKICLDAEASTLLAIGVHLSHCEFRSKLFDRYVKEVQARNLADHPLKAIKSMTLRETFLTPFALFPDLEQLNLIYDDLPLSVGYKFVNYKIAVFLEHYKNAPGQHRFLSMDVWELRLEPELSGRRLALDEVVGLMESPVAWAEERLHSQELHFVKENASAKLIIKSYHKNLPL